MGTFSYSQPSSSSAESMPSEDGEIAKGLFQRCRCGALLRPEVSPDGDNRGRLSLKCPLLHRRGVHCDKWWDVCVTEEVDKIKSMILQMEERLDFTYLARMNQLEQQGDQLKAKFDTVVEDMFFMRRPFGRKLREVGERVAKNWVVISLSLCLILSLVCNLLSLTI